MPPLTIILSRCRPKVSWEGAQEVAGSKTWCAARTACCRPTLMETTLCSADQ